MSSEKQYIELYEQCREMILRHSSEVMNAQRDAAFERFKKNGFPKSIFISHSGLRNGVGNLRLLLR